MQFNSTLFVLYLPVVVFAYYHLSPRWRQYLLLAASYFCNRSGLMVRVSSSAGQISYYNIMYLHSIALRYIVCAPVDGCMKTE